MTPKMEVSKPGRKETLIFGLFPNPSFGGRFCTPISGVKQIGRSLSNSEADESGLKL